MFSSSQQTASEEAYVRFAKRAAHILQTVGVPLTVPRVKLLALELALAYERGKRAQLTGHDPIRYE